MLKEVPTNNNVKTPPRKRKKKKTKYTAEFVGLFNDIERCVKCGFAMAHGEEKMHSSYHSSYEKYAKKVIKEDGVDIIYNYIEFSEQEKHVEGLKLMIENKDESVLSLEDLYESFIEMVTILEYNASIRFYDFNKEHPRIGEYRILLLNSPYFVSKLSDIIPQKYLEDKIRQYISNRRIKFSMVLSDEYIIYTGVEESYSSDILERLSYTDLSHLDTLSGEEDDNEAAESDDSLDSIEDLEKSLSWLGKLVVG